MLVSPMSTGTLNITSRQEAEALQAGLRQFRARGGREDRIPTAFLADLLDYSHPGTTPGQLFWATVDLEITHMFMELDMAASVDVWNEHFSRGRPHADASPLQSPDALHTKMTRLHKLTSFTLRCRAFWDKYVGILFLLYDPTNYERFIQGGSKLKFLTNHARDWPPLSPHLKQCLDNHTFESIAASAGLNNTTPGGKSEPRTGVPASSFPDNLLGIIDNLNRIRTAEAHGTGTLRKWVLTKLSPRQSKEAWLIINFNGSVYFMNALRETLRDFARSTSSGCLAP